MCQTGKTSRLAALAAIRQQTSGLTYLMKSTDVVLRQVKMAEIGQGDVHAQRAQATGHTAEDFQVSKRRLLKVVFERGSNKIAK